MKNYVDIQIKINISLFILYSIFQFIYKYIKIIISFNIRWINK